jgi:hypothetical protein
MVIDKHPRDRGQRRPWWFLPAVAGIVLGGLVGLLTPESLSFMRQEEAPASSSRLPTAEQQRAVVQALENSGAHVTRVGATKFDWLFGNASPTSALFQGTLRGEEFWLDVHFLATPLKSLTACSNRGASGETEFTISVNGQPQVWGDGKVTGGLGAAGPMYFGRSEQLFVMTPHAPALDALRGSLAVSTPPC